MGTAGVIGGAFLALPLNIRPKAAAVGGLALGVVTGVTLGLLDVFPRPDGIHHPCAEDEARRRR
jgi:hypothetical protein